MATMQKSARRHLILMGTASKIARNNCTAAEITKLVREHYEPPPGICIFVFYSIKINNVAVIFVPV